MRLQTGPVRVTVIERDPDLTVTFHYKPSFGSGWDTVVGKSFLSYSIDYISEETFALHKGLPPEVLRGVSPRRFDDLSLLRSPSLVDVFPTEYAREWE